MVVAVSQAQLIVVGIDAGAHSRRFAKIKRCRLDRFKFPGGNQVGIDGSESGSVESELVIEDIALSLSREIELRVVGEVHDGRLVGGG